MKSIQQQKQKKTKHGITIVTASLQQKIKILKTIIRPAIEYVFIVAPFYVPDIKKLYKLLIKLTKFMCNIPKESPNILAQLPHQTFNIEVFSTLPRYVTTLNEQLTHTLNDPSPLGHIYQRILKFIANKYGGVEHLPRFKFRMCSRSPTNISLYIH